VRKEAWLARGWLGRLQAERILAQDRLRHTGTGLGPEQLLWCAIVRLPSSPERGMPREICSVGGAKRLSHSIE